MKAILVIDVPDDKKYANDKWFIEGEEIGIRNMTEKGEFGEYYKEIDDWEKFELKPLPKKLSDDEYLIKYEEIIGHEDYIEQARGYNRCIDEILGEEDDR